MGGLGFRGPGSRDLGPGLRVSLLGLRVYAVRATQTMKNKVSDHDHVTHRTQPGSSLIIEAEVTNVSLSFQSGGRGTCITLGFKLHGSAVRVQS